MKLSEMTGIIIYTGESDVPDQLFFIPLEVTENLEKTIETYFNHSVVNVAFMLHFKPIERILPNLRYVMQNIAYVPGYYGLIKNPIRISIGKFVFNHSFKSEIPEDTTIHNAVIYIKNQSFRLKVSDLPDSYGIPKLFMALP